LTLSILIEHVLLEDKNDFNPFLNTLEDLLAYKKTWPSKRVRIKDSEDKNDPVKFVSIISSTSSHTISTGNSKSVAAKRFARSRKTKSKKDL